MIDRTEDKPLIKSSSFVPKSIAQRCPICNGFGTLKYGSLVCHGCQGKGYILVPAERGKDV